MKLIKNKFQEIDIEILKAKKKINNLRNIKINYLLRLHNSGMTYKEIGELLGVSKQAIHQQFKAYDF